MGKHEMKSSYVMRESQADIDAKNTMMLGLVNYMNLRDWKKLYSYEHLFEPKYKIDCVLLVDGKVASFVECKTSNSDKYVYINSAKIQRGASLARANATKFSLLALNKKTSEVFVLRLASGDHITHNKQPIWITDNRQGHNNGDDSEPAIRFRWEEMNKITGDTQ